jgi:dihydroorotase
MSGLESVFRVLCTLDIPLHRILEMICFNPRKIFRLPAGSITEGAPADITIFSPSGQHLFSKADIRSRSANNPFLGRELKGRVIGVVNNTRY